MILPPLVFPGRTHQNYAQIISPGGRDGQGGFKRMLQLLDGAGTPPKYLIICVRRTQNLAVCSPTKLFGGAKFGQISS